jgi:hypothetical protein
MRRLGEARGERNRPYLPKYDVNEHIQIIDPGWTAPNCYQNPKFNAKGFAKEKYLQTDMST